METMQDVAHILANEIAKRSKAKWQVSVTTDYYIGTIVLNNDTHVMFTRFERKDNGKRAEVMQQFDKDVSKWATLTGAGTTLLCIPWHISKDTPFYVIGTQICINDFLVNMEKSSATVTPEVWETPATADRLKDIVYKVNLAFNSIVTQMNDVAIDESLLPKSKQCKD
jgi:hypothetical protein